MDSQEGPDGGKFEELTHVGLCRILHTEYSCVTITDSSIPPFLTTGTMSTMSFSTNHYCICNNCLLFAPNMCLIDSSKEKTIFSRVCFRNIWCIFRR